MNQHFQCTACGKCCYGQLPLTWKDALANVARFPLCLVWTPVQQNARDFQVAAKMGVKFRLQNKSELAVLIVPTSFIPKDMKCPALQDNNLCGIHDHKPARCKTMPFYPYKDEKFQEASLQPREGWLCDTSSNAPLVYQDRKIIDRKDFDEERQEILSESPLLKRYADYMMKYSFSLMTNLMHASTAKSGGRMITSLSSFLTATRCLDAKKIAQAQCNVLERFIAETAHDVNHQEFQNYYKSWAKEMSYLAKSADIQSSGVQVET